MEWMIMKRDVTIDAFLIDVYEYDDGGDDSSYSVNGVVFTNDGVRFAYLESESDIILASRYPTKFDSYAVIEAYGLDAFGGKDFEIYDIPEDDWKIAHSRSILINTFKTLFSLITKNSFYEGYAVKVIEYFITSCINGEFFTVDDKDNIQHIYEKLLEIKRRHENK